MQATDGLTNVRAHNTGRQATAECSNVTKQEKECRTNVADHLFVQGRQIDPAPGVRVRILLLKPAGDPFHPGLRPSEARAWFEAGSDVQMIRPA